ncbi:monovalent cation/H(+) antiporter subunit G [Achromobacter sp. GG226]|uniref:cation:proton antiporter n=1 Tax=Verticiella alkaliphila TaxID=2779529 RepID=UPI001C0B22EA|nr:monovalent cation/H(+) antiporter subunit G [Verticiella sp. GG226]MBU4609835.1 monovalent cation/H(+) antiporter subunit G [Verticiella sp. GG226]
MIDAVTIVLLLASAVFFTGGTLGLLRFGDTLTRLHALTKADNLGLGFLVSALILQSESVAVAVKLGLIWLLAMGVGSAGAYLIARHARGVANAPTDKE